MLSRARLKMPYLKSRAIFVWHRLASPSLYGQGLTVITPIYNRADLAACTLPIEQMLQIDRVTEITETGIRCEMDLPQHWVFPLHFPGNPIFPACLMIEAAGQGIAIWGWHHKTPGNPRLARVRASFESAVRMEDGVLSFVGRIRRRKNICVGEVELFCGTRRVAQVDETLAWV
jgi:3-hydroxymyristoyl/3-hydroxydecanoyl-(acyl carrier protein) dehydratase